MSKVEMMREEKKKGALMPRLRFPEFRDAGEWAGTAVGKLLTESCQPGSKGDKAKKLTVKLWGKGVFEKNETSRGSVNTQYYSRSSGQFIYSKLDFLNQAFGIIPNHLDGFESTVDLPCFDLCAGVVSVFFLEYVKRDEFYKKYGEIADGGRKAKRIQVDNFLSLPIVLPPQVKEQQRIADCLSSLDERITAEANKLDALKIHKNGLLKQLFPAEGETLPALRFSEFRDAGEWLEKNINDICELKSGKFIAATDIFECHNDGLYPCYGGNGLRGYTATYTHSGKYPLIGRQGALCGNIKMGNGQFHATEHALVATAAANVDVTFLFYMLDFLNLNRYATGQAQPGLSVEVLEKISAFIPKNNVEQQRIADCLSSLDELIATQAQKIELLKSHKKGLMQQLFPIVDEVLA